ncbi:glycosyltransferase family 2 protein, partial [Bacillus haikouensis]|uniref:glycosyltransferase family A protein n=1 Tax=Bacillus haikouensis TaxID=1510468 RepID=UPI00155649CE
MLDILYKIYFKIRKKDSKFMLLKKLRTLFVILIRKSINIYAKKYYCYFPLRKNKTGLNTEEMRHTKVIVSLTSFPSRISTIWITIESLLRQTFKPDEIILWLAEEQFDGYDSLPTKLLRLQDKGLKIRFCDDLRSHKKYYYTFQEYPDCIVITVDDDVIYPTNTINALMEIHKKFPDSICCNRGHLIKKTFEKEIAPYNQWVQNPLNFEGPSKLI